MLPFETYRLNLLFLRLKSLICYPLKIYRASNVVLFLVIFFYIAKLNEFFAFFWGGGGLKCIISGQIHSTPLAPLPLPQSKRIKRVN